MYIKVKKKKHVTFALCLLSIFTLSNIAKAQETTNHEDNAWDNTIIVTPHYEGPALMKLIKGNNVMWIIGIPEYSTPELVFNSNHIAQIMRNADILFTRSYAGVGFSSMFTILEARRARDGNFLNLLSQNEKDKTNHLATQYNINLNKYKNISPVWAGFKFTSELNENAHISDAVITRNIVRIARANHVKVRPLSANNATPLLNYVINMPLSEQLDCFIKLREEANFWVRNAASIQNYWNNGEYENLRTIYSQKPKSCLNEIAHQSNLLNTIENEVIGNIDSTLNNHHRSVAIVGQESLFNTEIIETLRGRGIIVQQPL